MVMIQQFPRVASIGSLPSENPVYPHRARRSPICVASAHGRANISRHSIAKTAWFGNRLLDTAWYLPCFTGELRRSPFVTCSLTLWFGQQLPCLRCPENAQAGFREFLPEFGRHLLGARLRGRMATQRSKKGSEKVLGRVLGKGSGAGFWEGGLLWVLQ